jgi:hypothetical protein
MPHHAHKPFDAVSILMVDMATGAIAPPRKFTDVEGIVDAYDLKDSVGIAADIRQYAVDGVVHACIDPDYADEPGQRQLVFAHTASFLAARVVA